LGLSRDLPDSVFEARQSLRSNRSFDLWAARKTKSDAASYRPYDDLPVVCTTESSPIVRAIVDHKFLVLFNKVVQIGGRYVAEDLSVRDTDLTIVKMQVTNLELLSTVNDSEFVPPAIASSFPVPVAPREIARQAIGGDAPIYPPVARSQHAEGVVTLDAVITKEGRIGELEVLSGPKALQRAAYDAVKTWKYKPYLVAEQPVEVQTHIGVMFHIR
ncbi:MAG: energy transducer TonB, partial [Silvibacterium sp.]